jgi:DNA-binding CsgD family transcriptional regulator
MNRGQPREALSDHQQALALSQESNDERGMAQSLDLLGFDSYFLGEVIQGAAYGEQAVLLLRKLDDRQGLVNTLANLSMRARFDTEVLGEVELNKLVQLSETALDIARSMGYRRGEANALARAAICLCRAGDYGRGLEYLRRALSIAEEIEHRELVATVHLALGSELYLGLLAFAEARQHLEAALAAAHELGSIALTFLVTAPLVTACILQKDLARAQGLLEALLPAGLSGVADSTLPLRSCWAARAELELALGEPEHALAIVERLLAGTVNLRAYGPYAVPYLAWLRGKALAALGRMDEATADLQGALPVARAQGQRHRLWRLHAELGNVFGAGVRRADAEREFSAGRTIIQELKDTLSDGALRDHFLAEALAAMPAAPALTPRRAAMKDYGGLSERERQVATLIAQGKSNRAIAKTLVISVRTVEAHITRILDKLGFASRAEIAVWAAAKGFAPPSE